MIRIYNGLGFIWCSGIIYDSYEFLSTQYLVYENHMHHILEIFTLVCSRISQTNYDKKNFANSNQESYFIFWLFYLYM